jgi:hypothetical protein
MNQLSIMNFTSDEDVVESPSSRSLPFAGVLPLVTRTVHQVLNGVPNTFLDVSSTRLKQI